MYYTNELASSVFTVFLFSFFWAVHEIFFLSFSGVGLLILFVFAPEYSGNSFASFRRQCLRHLYQRLGELVRAMAWRGHVKKRKPRSRTHPTVDGRDLGAGWWWQLIPHVPEMPYSEKTAENKKNIKKKKIDEKSKRTILPFELRSKQLTWG